MTKKDYEAIAMAFRENRIYHEPGSDARLTLDTVAARLADIMEDDNPRFSRSRFLAACRGEDSKDSAGRTVRYGSEAKRSTVKYAAL